jgi:uncharacterized membrane protein
VTEHLVSFFGNLPKELITVIIAMIPIAELRGAIPWALADLPVGGGLGWPEAYVLAVIGNYIPVIPLLLFFDKAYALLNRFKIFNKFFEWLFARTQKRGKVVEKYKSLGLIIFVGIPLPVTGAWTGTLAAFIFGIRNRVAFPAILAGILMSGVIMTLASLGVLGFIDFLLK